MSLDRGTILVLGATGTQGGAVARELMRRGWAVRALVRDPQSPGARALAGDGADVIRGDLDDPGSVDSALRGRVHGVYSVQAFNGPDGIAGEERQGRAVADAAARAGVAHFVYGSVAGAERNSGIPHFDSKARIEAYIDGLGLPATVLRPAMFMSNFTVIGPARAAGGLVLTLALKPGTVLQMIAPADIGVLAADAFDRPEEYLGTQLEIAGDALTGPEMAAVFERVSGIPVRFQEQDLGELRSLSEETALMFGWFNDEGFRADIASLRAARPDLMTLVDWARQEWKTPE